MRNRGWGAIGRIAIAGAMLMLALIGTVRAQNPVFVHVAATSPKSAAPGTPFTLVVTVTIDKDYHIQGNNAKDPYIPTVVTIGPVKGVTIGKIVYPPAVKKEFSGELLPVYEKKVEIKATLTADKGVKPGKITLPVSVKYQGCNDKVCYPPSTLKAEATVEVTASGK